MAHAGDATRTGDESAGWSATSPSCAVTEELVETLVRAGGYRHPLFHPTVEERRAGRSAPLMGQGVLLLAGGLAEQTGALDDAVALVGLENVSFHAMVHAGASLRLVINLLGTAVTASGKQRSEYRWTVLDDRDTVVLEATAVLLRTSNEER